MKSEIKIHAEKLLAWAKKYPEKSLLILSVAAVIILGAVSGAQSPEQAPLLSTIDTQIPKGLTLVQIDIINIEAIDGMVGEYTLATLFTVKTANQKGGIVIGKQIRLVRSTVNPTKFGAVLPDEKLKNLMQYEGPFYVAIQNPNGEPVSTEFSSNVRKSRIRMVD